MSDKLMFFEGKEVEVFEFEGKVLFNPRHVARCLELSDSALRNHLATMNKKQALLLKNSDVRDKDFRKLNNRGETFITESGVYKLSFKSKKEEAERFQDWVTDEVLPTIRKTGAYMTDNTLEKTIADPDFMIGLLVNLKEEKQKRLEEEQKRIEAEKLNEKNKPLVTFAERCLSSKDSILVRELAKLAADEDYNIGEKKLYTKLREWGLILKYSTEPSQRAMDMKLFEVIKREKDTPYGIKLIHTTKVTPKGQVYIIERLLKEQELIAN